MYGSLQWLAVNKRDDSEDLCVKSISARRQSINEMMHIL